MGDQFFRHFILSFARVNYRASQPSDPWTPRDQAWDRGMGAWPQSSVRHRIECVQRFAGELKQRRDEIVRILMWEVWPFGTCIWHASSCISVSTLHPPVYIRVAFALISSLLSSLNHIRIHIRYSHSDTSPTHPPCDFRQICKTYEQACAEVDRTIVYIVDTIAALKSLDNSSSSFEVASGVIAQVRFAYTTANVIHGNMRHISTDMHCQSRCLCLVVSENET